jgi:hypothetical protein
MHFIKEETFDLIPISCHRNREKIIPTEEKVFEPLGFALPTYRNH